MTPRIWMSHSVALGFLDIPVDLLLYILDYLDAYDLVQARKTCNMLRQVIDSSEKLQYTIDLKYFHMIPAISPGSALSITTRRKLLRQSETAWQKATYSQRCHIPLPDLYVYHQWSHGVLLIVVPEQMNFVQLPLSASDHTDNTKWRHWSCKISGVIRDLCFSPPQDLLVLLTSAPPGENHRYEVSFRSLSGDSQVHPDAASAVMKVPDAQANSVNFINSSHVAQAIIFGDYYGLMCRNVYVNGFWVDVLQVWNWKIKDWYRFKPFDRGVASYFRFVLNDRLLVADTAGQLTLYSLVNSSNTIQLTAKFSLPALPSMSFVGHIFFIGNQHDATLLCSSWFQASTRSQLIAIEAYITHAERDECHFILYIEQDTFLELESTYRNLYAEVSQDSPALPWSAWGLECTRFLPANISITGGLNHCYYGFRSAELLGDAFLPGPGWDLQPRQLRIRDFNPHRVRHYRAGDGTKWQERLVEGEPPNSELQSHFLEPIGGLPYLEITTREKFLATGISMDESRVFVSLATRNATIESIEVLVFS